MAAKSLFILHHNGDCILHFLVLCLSLDHFCKVVSFPSFEFLILCPVVRGRGGGGETGYGPLKIWAHLPCQTDIIIIT